MLRSRWLQVLFGITILCLATGAARAADFTLDWDQLSWPQAASPNNFSESFNVGPGSVTVTFTGDLDAFFNGSPSIRDTPTGGLSPVQDVLRANANFGTGSSNSVPIVIDFSHSGGVTDVSFSLFSVDRFPGSGGSWDEVTVTATNGGTTFNPSNITLGNPNPNVGNQILSANTVTGTSAVPATSSDANATFTFNQPGIQQITIDFRYPGTNANPPSQSIALHDIDFSISPASSVDLSLAKSVNDPTPNAGDTVTFTLSVTNEGGQPASNVEVSDLLPGGYSFSGASGTGSYDSGSGIWTVGGVPADSAVAIDLFAVVNASGPYLNTAEVVAMDETDIDSTPDNDDPDEDDQDTATVSINLPPDAVDDTVEASTNKSLDIDVLDNDSDPQGDPLRITLPSPSTAAGGVVVVNNNGTPTEFADDFVRYQPPTGFSGSDSFIYQIDDGSGGSDTATVSIDVIAQVDLSLTKTVDDASPNTDDTITFIIVVSNESGLVATNVEVADELPDGYDFVGSSGAGVYDDDSGIWTIPLVAAGGSASLGIQVNVNASGPYLNIAEIVALDQIDADSTPDNDDPTEDDQDSATIVLNLPPEAVDDTVEADTNTPLNIDVLDNDSDPQGDPLRITLPSPTTTAGGSVVVDTNGTPANFDDDFVRYQPPNGFSGSDSFIYQIDDGSGGTDTATVSIDVIARVDLSLTKTVDDASPNAGETVTFTLVVSNNSSLVATNVEVDDDLPGGYDFAGSSGAGSYDENSGTWTIPSVAAGGSATLGILANVNASGPYLNIAEIVALDQVDTDSTPDNDDPTEDDQDSATILLNLPPEADDDAVETDTNTPLDIDVLDNDSDPQDDPLRITLPSSVTTAGGSVAVNNNGTPGDFNDDFVRYQPPPGFSGIDDFTYQVDDGSGGTDTATVTIDVIARVDLSLTKTVDDASPNSGETVVFTLVVTNDSGLPATNIEVSDEFPDGYEFTGSSGSGVYDDDSGIWTIPAVAAGSSATLNLSAVVNSSGSYLNVAEIVALDQVDTDSTPDNDDPGEDDQDSASISLNLPPVAVDDSAETNLNTALAIDVLANDSDPQDDPLQITLPSATTSQGGSVAVNTNGTPADPSDDFVNYQPPAGFGGTDSFDYALDDGSGGTDTATVTIEVIAIVADLSLTKTIDAVPTAGSQVTFTLVVANAGPDPAVVQVTDRLADGFTFVGASGDGSYSPGNGVWTAGTVEADATATLSIVAGVNPSGSYGNTAEITASNAFDPDSTPGNNNPTEDDRATISSSFNNPPNALDDGFSVAIDTPTSLDVLANDQDPDGDAVTLSLLSTISAAGAGLSIDDSGTPGIPGDDRIGYVPRPGFNGIDSFEYRIEDPSGGSDTATVTVTVSTEFNLFLQIRPDRREATVGEVLRYTIIASNVGTNNLSGLRWTDRIPPGFQFVPESVRVEPPVPGLNVEGLGPVVFDGLTIPAGQTLTVSYMLRVGAGSTHGEYVNVVDASDAGGPIGNTASVTVEVVGDPDFEESTVLGKVFHDRNGNARQDEGEEGLGGVRLATPEGLVVETDGHGRYHLAGMNAGRGERGRNQALKVDPASLPAGTEFTTENPRVQRLTHGLPSRFDFGVRIPGAAPADDSRSVLPLPEGGSLLVTEDPAGLEPWLSISGPERVSVDRGGHLAPVSFHYHVNYTAFVNRIELVITSDSADPRQTPLAEISASVDAFGTIVWTPPAPMRARVGDRFRYFLRVDDGLGRTDATRVRSMLVGEVQASATPSPAIDNATTELLLSRNDLSTRNIPLRGSRIRIRGERLPRWAGLTIDGDRWPVDGTGSFAAEYLVPLGRRVFDVELRTEHGAVVEYDLPLTVTGRHLFLVGLAEATASGSSLSGRVEPLAADDRFDDEFSTDGRLALYLKGKIKGKYLMTAQLDTGEESLSEVGNLGTKDPSDVFRRVDPDRYYAVYGDDSTTIRDVDSQGKFYVRVDWDRSYALWGNYHTGLTGTELVRYNRSLYGAKLHRRTFRTTSTGDPRGELILFGSETQTAPGHSEFLGTGGSLYYLKHTGVVPGSDKAWVEIRQRDTDRVIDRRTMIRGADYDIDERQGRLILARPLRQVVEQFRPSIVQDEPLDGDPAVLLVDYEYVPEGFDAGQLSAGVRSRQWLGDHVGLGASFVNEERDGQNYEATGTDLT